MKDLTVTEASFFHYFIPSWLTEYELKFNLTCHIAVIQLMTMYCNYRYWLECTLVHRLVKTQKLNVVRNEELFMKMQFLISLQKI